MKRRAGYLVACSLLAGVLYAQPCDDTLLPNTPPLTSGTQNWQATNCIAADNGFGVNGATVTFHAGEYIHLGYGFHGLASFHGSVLAPAPPSVVSVTPSNGTGWQQTFTFVASDPNGGADISGLQLLFVNPNDHADWGYANACDIWIDRWSRGIWLRQDVTVGWNWGTPATIGGTGQQSLNNPQCTINPNQGASSINWSGVNLTVNLAITFTSAYAGAHDITMDVGDSTHLWQGALPIKMGTWTAGNSGFTPIRISAGGPYTDSLNQVWAADYGYSQSSTYATNATITGTPDPALYRTERWSAPTLTYQFGVPNGSYTVTLKFAEIYYTAAGQRYMNVTLNGTTVLTNLDVWTAAGGPNRAYDLVFPVSVTNGQLTITLTCTSPNQSGEVNAIQIVAGTPQQYYLTTGVSPVGGGTVSPGSGWYNPGSPVTITATPAAGYQFTGFAGSVNSGSNPLTVTMNSSMTVTANFSQTATNYPLTTTVTPAGGGTVSPSCPSGCSYSGGSQVTIRATPAPGYQFTGFTGSVNSGSNPLTVTMNSAMTETANFTAAVQPDFSLSVSPGSATVAPTGSINYTVVATPLNGYSGGMTFSVSGLPSGASSQFFVSGLAATMTITTSGTPIGNYPLTVTGQGAGVSHTATANLNVTTQPDFSLGMTPGTTALTPGAHATYTVAATAVNGFGGVVNLVASGLPSGATASFSPASITGSGTSTLTISTSSTGGSGAFTIMASGSSGPLTHNATASLLAGGHLSFSARDVGTQQEDYTYNDNNPIGGYTHYVDILYPGGIIVPLSGSAVKSCTAANVTATPGDGSGDSFKVTYRAPSGTSTGHRDVTCHYDDGNFVFDDLLGHAMTVYDATPSVTSVERYDGPPGNHLFIQGEGPVGVRIKGTNFGPNPLNDQSRLTVSGSGVTVGNITWWHDDGTEIDVVFNIGSTALGPYTVTVTSMGTSGQGFQSGGSPASQSKGSGQMVVTAPVVSLIQFGWGNNQDLWKAATFASNGDSQIGSVVWSDPNGDGNVTINEPVALKAGSDAPYLSNIVLRTSPAISTTAELQVVVIPGDFTFYSPVPLSFVNGEATVDYITLSGQLPGVILNASYQFQWNIRFSPALPWRPFRTTTHKLFLMHSTYPNNPEAYRATTKRLDYVTSLASNQSNLGSVVLRIQQDLYPHFSSGIHIATPNNVWAALDSAYNWDCESLSAIAAAELQQLGYLSANVEKAYATGAIPPGNTDATDQESQIVNGDVYSLSFDSGNYFEGFVYLSTPDTAQPTAVTIRPASVGPFLGFTGCTVSLVSTADGIDNRLLFRVLTSTYALLNVSYQEWYWDVVANAGKTPPNQPALPDHIPLPRPGCPPEESIP